MSNRQPTEESFLKDVEKHEIKVLLDNGLYRHLRFASTGPHSWNQWFDIVTFPDRLVYTGDMGTYVFARLEDMFEFFRTRPKDGDKKLYINLSYWGEKLEAVDRGGRESGFRMYSPEKLKERIEEGVKDWIEDFEAPYDSDEAETAAAKKTFEEELREVIDNELLSCLEDSEHEARQALNDFKWEFNGSKTYEFTDTWEWDCEEYTSRFIWCCYAIAWGIKKYDALKVETI